MRRFLLPLALLAPLAALAAFACSDDAPTGGQPAAQGGQGGGAGAGSGGEASAGSAGSGGAPFCGLSGISKGPWVLSVDDTSALVRWETCAPAGTRVAYGPEGGALDQSVEGQSTSHEILTETRAILPDRAADLAGVWWLHEARITGLSPGTCYGYEAAGEARGRLCTARPPGSPLRFAFVADTNPGIDDNAKKLFTLIADDKPDLVLHGGDMQYYSSGLEPYAWWFGAVAPLLRAAPLWPAVGNHEKEKDDEFADYYARFWGGNGLDNQDDAYRFTSAGVHFFSLNTEAELGPGSPQLAWLDQNLAKAQASPGFRLSVVFMHRPLATCGDTGELGQEREALLPLLRSRGVRLVLAGHMHGYERFDLDGLPLLVAGGGGAAIGDVDANPQRPLCSQRKAQGAFVHALFFELGPDALQARAVDAQGQQRDSFSVPLP